jgi:acetate kinase
MISVKTMWVLTVNAGSSSFNVAMYEQQGLTRKAALSVERIGSSGGRLLITRSGGTTERKIEAKDHAGALDQVCHHLPELVGSDLRAVGHRIVLGGSDDAKSEPITARLLNDLGRLPLTTAPTRTSC